MRFTKPTAVQIMINSYSTVQAPRSEYQKDVLLLKYYDRGSNEEHTVCTDL